MIVLEESRGGEEHQATQAGQPRPAGLPYLRSPPAPVFCRQASLSFLSLCVQVCVPRTSVDIANLPKIDSSKKIHNLNPLKVHIPKYDFKCLVTGCNPEF
jgi:hypothetical protein